MPARVLLPDKPDGATYIVISGVNPEPWEVGEAHPVRRAGKLSAAVSPSLKLTSYQEDIREQLADHEVPMIDGDVRIFFWFWRRLDSWLDHNGHKKTGHHADSTNLQKACEDALQGVVYKNDIHNRLVGSEIIDQSTETTPAIIIAYRPWTHPESNAEHALTLFQRFVQGVKNNYFNNDW